MVTNQSPTDPDALLSSVERIKKLPRASADTAKARQEACGLKTSDLRTLVTLLLYAIERVKTQVIFDRDPYESWREALPGSRLLKALVFYQLLKDPSERGMALIGNESQDAQATLGSHWACNTLTNALCQQVHFPGHCERRIRLIVNTESGAS